MSDFNVDPDYKMNRRKQRKTQNTKNNILIATAIIVILAVIVFVAISIFSGKTPANTVVTPTGSDKTETAVQTDVADTTVPGKTTSPAVTPSATATGTDTHTKPVKVTTKIFIDAGHGAMNQSMDSIDRGASGLYFELTGKYEDDLNLAIALKVRDLLEEIGYTVDMTRTDKVSQYVSLTDRADMANKSGAVAFVSIHANSADASAYGSRVFYYSDRSDASDCVALANSIKKEIDSTSDSDIPASRKKALVLADNFAVIRETKIPAVLVETCFLTNGDDANLAANEEWQNKMAAAIANGIIALYPLKIIYK